MPVWTIERGVRHTAGIRELLDRYEPLQENKQRYLAIKLNVQMQLTRFP